MTMDFKSFFLCILLLYNVEAKLREVVCPDYCNCDLFKNFKRAVCQSKKLVSAEIGIPAEVEILDLSYNQISELGNRVFANDGLTDLKLLNLSNNKISQIHMFAFEGINNLKSLDLSFNILEYFLEQWFSSWQNLEELYLRGNNLVLINKQPPLNLPSLKILDLSQSKIEYFNPNVFTLLPKLEILDISSNYMQHLNFEVIVPLTNLKLLVAKDNNLECKEKFLPLLRHLIRKNSITYVGPCIRTVRRMRTQRPNIEESLSVSNKPENSEYFFQDGSNKDLELLAPVGYNRPSDKIGKSEKKIDKVANSGKEEGANMPVDTDKLAISRNLETVRDSEILGDLQNLISSDKFQKMKMESPSPNNKLENFVPFNNDDKLEISENNQSEKIKDDDLFDKLKNFVRFEKLKKVSASDSNAKLVRETPTNAPEMSDLKPTVPEIAEKNAWMVDDENIKSDNDKSKNYIENCNGTKKVNFNNVLDKMAMEIIEISPSMILILFTLFGIMLGLVIGCSVQIKEIPKVKKPSNKFLDLFKRRKPKNKKQEINELDQGDIKIPIQEDDVKKKEDIEQQSAMQGNDEESDDCDICEEEREMLRERKNKKQPQSPFEDQTFLLDNESVQDGSTPMMGKKEFSSFKG